MNLPPLCCSLPPAIGLMALSLVVSGTPLHGQLTESASSSVPAGDTIELAAFVVSTSGNDGSYLASESTTGTRAVAKIRDLPFPVQVVTSEFVRDFNFTEVDNMLAYTSGFTPGNTQGGGDIGKYTRGFTADFQLRNGFNRVGLNDRSSIDRIEIIKGPYAAIYGRAQPGGIINIITKQPKDVSEQSLGFTLGSLDRRRGELSTTGPVPLPGLTGKLLYRIDAAWETNEGGQDFVRNNYRPVSGVLQWKPTSRTTLTFEGEYVTRRNNEGNVVPYVRPQGLSGDAFNQAVTSYATGLLYFSTQGPKYFTDRTQRGGTVTLEHRLNDVMTLRANANLTRRMLSRFSFGGGAWLNINPITATENIGSSTGGNDRTSNQNVNEIEQASAQIDLLSRWQTGSVQHQFLLTGDFLKNDDRRTVFTLPNSAASVTNPFGNLNVDPAFNLVALDPVHPVFLDRDFYSLKPHMIRRTQDLFNTTTVYGAFGSYRATMFSGRLIVSVGARYDRARGTYRDWSLTDPRPADPRIFVFKPNALTHNEGINYQIIKEQLILFAAHSTSFNTQSPRDASSNQTALDNERGEGYEGGVKAELFDSKLTFTATVYDISRRNVRLANPDAATDPSAPAFILAGKQKAKGTEFDGQYSPTRDTTLFIGLGYTDIRTLNTPSVAASEVNRQVAKVPRLSGGAGLRYRLSQGPLHGLAFTVGARYLGETWQNNTYVHAITPSYILWDTGLSFTWKAPHRLTQRLQVNVRNVFDRNYITTAVVPGDPREILTTYTIQF